MKNNEVRLVLFCSYIGQNVRTDGVEELGQVYDEHTIGVQARTAVKNSPRTGYTVDTRQRSEVQVSQDQAWKVLKQVSYLRA